MLGKEKYVFNVHDSQTVNLKLGSQLRCTFRKQRAESDTPVYKVQLSRMQKIVKEHCSTRWILTNQMWQVGPAFSNSEKLSSILQFI